jgi:hypothetical protein
VLGQPVDYGTEVEGGCPHPIGERAAVQVDPGASQDLALPIQRQMFRELADQHMRDGAFGRQT